MVNKFSQSIGLSTFLISTTPGLCASPVTFRNMVFTSPLPFFFGFFSPPSLSESLELDEEEEEEELRLPSLSLSLSEDDEELETTVNTIHY